MYTSSLYQVFALQHSEQNSLVLEQLLKVCNPQQVYLLGITERNFRTETLFTNSAPTVRTVSHYYFLVLVPKSKSSHLCEIQDRIENKLQNFIPATALVLYDEVFERWLTSGHSFAVGVKEKGLLIYHNPDGDSKEKESSEEFIQRSPQEIFLMANTNVEAFLAGADLFYKNNQYHMAAFMLHQVTEQSLCAMIQLRTGLRVVTHNLGKLIRYSNMFAHRVKEIFETGGKDPLFHLLQRAYIDSRYNDDYNITAKEIELLIEKTYRLVTVFRESGNQWLTEEQVTAGINETGN